LYCITEVRESTRRAPSFARSPIRASVIPSAKYSSKGRTPPLAKAGCYHWKGEVVHSPENVPAQDSRSFVEEALRVVLLWDEVKDRLQRKATELREAPKTRSG
jgi:hypothetical protein